MIHHAKLDIHTKQKSNAVNQTGITDNGNHCVYGAHCRYKTRNQIQCTNGLCNFGLGKAQIQCQQICHNDSDGNSDKNNEQCKQQVFQLCRFRKEVGIVVQRKCTGFFILKALDDS